jgi:hypothetical protein
LWNDQAFSTSCLLLAQDPEIKTPTYCDPGTEGVLAFFYCVSFAMKVIFVLPEYNEEIFLCWKNPNKFKVFLGTGGNCKHRYFFRPQDFCSYMKVFVSLSILLPKSDMNLEDKGRGLAVETTFYLQIFWFLA